MPTANTVPPRTRPTSSSTRSRTATATFDHHADDQPERQRPCGDERRRDGQRGGAGDGQRSVEHGGDGDRHAGRQRDGRRGALHLCAGGQSGTGTYGTLTLQCQRHLHLHADYDRSTARLPTTASPPSNVDTFTYQATDANGNTVTGTITVNIVDDVPTAHADTDSVTEGGDGHRQRADRRHRRRVRGRRLADGSAGRRGRRAAGWRHHDGGVRRAWGRWFMAASAR